MTPHAPANSATPAKYEEIYTLLKGDPSVLLTHVEQNHLNQRQSSSTEEVLARLRTLQTCSVPEQVIRIAHAGMQMDPEARRSIAEVMPGLAPPVERVASRVYEQLGVRIRVCAMLQEGLQTHGFLRILQGQTRP